MPKGLWISEGPWDPTRGIMKEILGKMPAERLVDFRGPLGPHKGNNERNPWEKCLPKGLWISEGPWDPTRGIMTEIFGRMPAERLVDFRAPQCKICAAPRAVVQGPP